MSDDERAETVEEPAAPSLVLSDDQLRPALELAFAVAVAGQRLKPPIVAPIQLKKFLKFQSLPNGALSTVRRVVDSDAGFRERVAKVVTAELADELAVVWLHKSEGWAERAAELVAATAAERERETAERDERSNARKAALSEAAAVKVRSELVALQAEAGRDRARRAEAEATLGSVVAERDAAIAAAAASQQEVVRLKERVATAQARIDQLVSERGAALAEVGRLSSRLEEALAANVVLVERASAVADDRRAAAQPTRPTSAPSAAVLDRSSDNGVDRAQLDAASRALGETAGALRDLAAALDRTSSAVKPSSTPDALARRGDRSPSASSGQPPPTKVTAGGSGTIARPGPPSATPRTGAAEPSGRPAATSGVGARRVPLSIPGGLVSDSTAAAEHLLRSAAATVIVDGYNVAKLGWPNFSLSDQRDRLLDALEDTVRRLGCSIIVVFDGADVPGVSTGRRLLRVRFSAAGISADQEIIALVVDSPAGQPMIVVTNDQEIVRGVRTAGANVVSSDQLLAVLRR